jgi:predicted DNA-binding WGR domain protein
VMNVVMPNSLNVTSATVGEPGCLTCGGDGEVECPYCMEEDPDIACDTCDDAGKLSVKIAGSTEIPAKRAMAYGTRRVPQLLIGIDMNKVTLFHAASKGGQKQWSIWIEDDAITVTVEWGLVGGNLQKSSDTTKPKGKVGTKAYKDERQCAQENYDRQIRKKREEGYRAVDDAGCRT